MFRTKVAIKGLGRGKKRLQHNIVDLSPEIPTRKRESERGRRGRDEKREKAREGEREKVSNMGLTIFLD